MSSIIQAITGMNDIMPDEIGAWRHIEQVFRQMAESFAFSEVRTPLLEKTELFVRSVGESSDIVSKEMYTFVDKDESSLTARPEGTASAVRAYVEHSVDRKEPISRWFYVGPMFRRERPARGRFRQFWQGGAEVFGDAGPYSDAELIVFVYRFLTALGIEGFEILVNSLGSAETRNRYRSALHDALLVKKETLSEESQRRLDSNPLRILDSKDPRDRAACADAPTIAEHLSPDDRKHFDTLCRLLTEAGVPFRVDPHLVRGLDYYSHTLFEVVGSGGGLGAQNALAGGGRYDGLVSSLGGAEVPSVGFAFGFERLLLVMNKETSRVAPDVAVVFQSPLLREKSFGLIQSLRSTGLRVEADWRGMSLKSQLRRSDKLGARWVVVVGEREWEAGTVQLKDLDLHQAQDISIDQLLTELQKRVHP